MKVRVLSAAPVAPRSVVQVPDLQGNLTFAQNRVYHMGDQNPLYLTTKRSVFYYTRRVPQNLQARFQSSRFVKCLHTRSDIKAARLSHELSSRLENIWDRMRLEVLDFRSDEPRSLVMGKDRVSTRGDFRLSDAFELYLQLKAIGKPEAFKIYTARNERYLVERIGDIHLEDLLPRHGAEFRDHLVGKGLSTASIKRVFSTIKAVVNLCISEWGLSVTNPFAGVYVPDVGAVTKRNPIPIDVIRVIQNECRVVDDDQRWLIALLSDTGMRLSEACGLLVDDIKLDTDIPHLDLKPHQWRRLKTRGSQRQIPLVGTSLWAAQRILIQSNSQFAFPRYCTSEGVKANSASGSLNKWLSSRVSDGCVIHSFRHSFRDRLRAVECPSDIVDALGGWSTAGVGSKYGHGFKLDQKLHWLRCLVDTNS